MFQERLSYFERLSGSHNRKKNSNIPKSLSANVAPSVTFNENLDNTTAVNKNSSPVVCNNYSKAAVKTNPIISLNIQDKDVIEHSLEDNTEPKTMHLEPETKTQSQLPTLTGNSRRKNNERTGNIACNKTIVIKEAATSANQNYQQENVREQRKPIQTINYQDYEHDYDIFGMNDFSEIDECIFEAYNCDGQELILTFFERKQKIIRPTKHFDQFCEMIDKFCLKNDDKYQEKEKIGINSDEKRNNEKEVTEKEKHDDDVEEITGGETEDEVEQTHIYDTVQSNQRNESSWLYNNSGKNLPDEELEKSSSSSSDDSEVIKRLSHGNAEKFNERRSTMFSVDGNLVGMEGSASMESIFYEFSRSELIIGETINEDNFEDVEVGIRYQNKILRIKELVTTEKNYIAGLGTVVNDYMPHLKMNEPPGLKDKSSYIFGNIIEIYDGAKAFFEALQNCADDDVEEVANVFITFAFIFDLYPEYAKNKTTSDFYLPEFDQICKMKQVELNDRRDLPGYLLTPIQRLAQYVTLLHTMQKDLIKETENVTKVTKAIELIKNAMKKGNDLITIDLIKHCPVDLTTKGSLIMGEKFTVLKPESYQAMVFLFENIIVFSKVSPRTTTEFRYVTSIDLTNLKVDSLKADLTTFQLTDYFKSRDSGESKKYTFELRAPSSRIKDLWTENIEKLLWRQLEEAKTYQSEVQLLRDQITADAEVVLCRAEQLNKRLAKILVAFEYKYLSNNTTL